MIKKLLSKAPTVAKGLGAFIFQANSSMLSVVIGLWTARYLTVAEFSIYALASSIWMTIAGVFQASVNVTAIKSWATKTASPATASAAAVGLTATLAVVAIAVSAALSPLFGWNALVTWSAFTISTFVGYDVAKRLAVSRGRVWRVVAIDAAVGLVIVLAVFELSSRGLGRYVIPAMGLAYLASILAVAPVVFARSTEPPSSAARPARDWVVRHWRELVATAGTSLVAAVGGQAFIVALSINGPDAVSAFRLLQTLFGATSFAMSALLLSQTAPISIAPDRQKVVMAARSVGLLALLSTISCVALIILAPVLRWVLRQDLRVILDGAIPYAVLTATMFVVFGELMVMRAAGMKSSQFALGVAASLAFAVAAWPAITLPFHSGLLVAAGTQLLAGGFGAWLIARFLRRKEARLTPSTELEHDPGPTR